MEYFIQTNDEELGPFQLAELFAHQKAGRLENSTPIRAQGSADWITFAELKTSFAKEQPVSYPAKQKPLPPIHRASVPLPKYAPPIPQKVSRPPSSYFPLIAFCVICLVVIIFTLTPKNSRKTDGVFEIATEKLDRGLPLNDREQQRMNDILNYKDNERAKEIERRNGEN